MKVQALTLAAATATAYAAKQLPSEISASSHLGQSLLAQSRRLEQQDEEEEDFTWITNYSLKFAGCHHHATYNSEVDEDADVRIQTSKLAHFRLCPSDSCNKCTKNYGEYVIDLATFAKTFVEAQKRSREYECQLYMYEQCNCQVCCVFVVSWYAFG